MTYVQRFPQLPVPELSGRTLALLVVVSLHVLLIGFVVRELRLVPVPEQAVPPDVTLLPDVSKPRLEPAQPRSAAPVIERVMVVTEEPILEIERSDEVESPPVDPRPLDSGSGIGPEASPEARVFPRQDPAHPLGRPAYPPMSARLGESGVVILNVCTDADGRTTDVGVRASSGFGRLDRAAVNHLRRPAVRLLPGSENGVPAPMCTELRVRFAFDTD